MGDCVMAFWNAPLEVKDHEREACSNAGYVGTALGVGVNYGKPVFGQFTTLLTATSYNTNDPNRRSAQRPVLQRQRDSST